MEGAGEKKLSKVIVPDKWKEGASNTTEGGGRKINENKLLSKKNRSSLSVLDSRAGVLLFFFFSHIIQNSGGLT